MNIDMLRNLNIITSKNKLNPKFQNILDKNPGVHILINESITFIHEDDMKLKIRMLMDGHDCRPTCVACKNTTKYDFRFKKFKKYCSHECAWQDPDNVVKAKQTKKQRYGNSNFNNREQAVETNLTKYGVKVPAENPDIVAKIRATKIERGSDDIASTKRHVTNLERYGATTFASSKISVDSDEKLRDGNTLKIWHQDKKQSLTSIAIKLGVSVTTVSRWMSKHEIPVRHDCSYTSSDENALVDFIKSIYTGEIIVSTRGVIQPYELDVYLPELKLAFEYDGVYWHSEGSGKPKKYHLTKTELCEDAGIRLIHVFSSDWVYKLKVAKSRIANLLNQSNRIYARKCSIVELSTSDKTQFLENNHIQGACGSRLNYGLMYQDKIVACITFGASRFSKQHEYELLRYCNVVGSGVVGGASRLFKHFIKLNNPQSIVTYSDKRWNTGGMYRQLGFDYLRTSKPNYFYFDKSGDTNALMSRNVFQKHKLKDKLSTFDPDLTEWVNMQNNGYDRVWDCGNDVWSWVK